MKKLLLTAVLAVACLFTMTGCDEGKVEETKIVEPTTVDEFITWLYYEENNVTVTTYLEGGLIQVQMNIDGTNSENKYFVTFDGVEYTHITSSYMFDGFMYEEDEEGVWSKVEMNLESDDSEELDPFLLNGLTSEDFELKEGSYVYYSEEEEYYTTITFSEEGIELSSFFMYEDVDGSLTGVEGTVFPYVFSLYNFSNFGNVTVELPEALLDL